MTVEPRELENFTPTQTYFFSGGIFVAITGVSLLSMRQSKPAPQQNKHIEMIDEDKRNGEGRRKSSLRRNVNSMVFENFIDMAPRISIGNAAEEAGYFENLPAYSVNLFTRDGLPKRSRSLEKDDRRRADSPTILQSPGKSISGSAIVASDIESPKLLVGVQRERSNTFQGFEAEERAGRITKVDDEVDDETLVV